VPKISSSAQNNVDFDVKIAFIDAGMVTKLNEKDQSNFFKLTWSVLKGDAASCSQLIRSLSTLELDPQVSESLERELNKHFEETLKVPIPDINVGKTIQGILFISASHGIKFEGNFALLLTQLITLEGIARNLDPEINIVGSTMPFLVNR